MSSDHFKVLQKEKIGRYAVATKNLEPGEIIFTEVPFAVGPKVDSYPTCLGCYAFVDGSYVCSKCKWPVCGPDCEIISRHANAECQVFSNAGIQWQKPDDMATIDPQLDCITPLRVLLAKEKNPELWNKEISVMFSHNDKRKEKVFWEAEKVNVVQFLRERCKLAERFSEDLIHQVCGILEVNAYEARTLSDNTVRALYPKLSILSHSCVPNTAHSILAGPLPDDSQDFKVIVRASVQIQSENELFSCYTYVLTPTILRRETLLETKYFECTCARCLDPTELGTHIGTLKCTKCDNGIIMSSQPTDMEAVWKCTHCEFHTSGGAVKKALLTMQTEMDAIDELGMTPQAIEQREQLSKKYRTVLHPRHYIHTSVRLALSQLYGRVEGYTIDDLPDLLLERKIEMCQEILKVLDVLEPGYTRLRGMTLYELHAPIIYLAKSQYEQDVVNEETLRKKFNEACSILEQSSKILSLEDQSSPEGSLGIIAQTALEQFRANMEAMIAAL